MSAAGEDRTLAYLVVRLAIGVSLLGHGLVRLPKLGVFHAHLMSEFHTSLLPGALVSGCGYVLPFVELLSGLLLVAGAMTRMAALAASCVMMILIFGATSIERFDLIGDQLVHTIFLAAVIAFRRDNRYSLDRLLSRSRQLNTGPSGT
ncbi:DoxX family protein [Mycobacterium sp. UM_CSW]|uniref:DoxX family protein n=1 Tax=Mycobacterium sp. UM_CSW TaxID=1370119 RepID=UPI00082C4FC0|nr:DoxX family protein [Mycobacterium sp. UM_CSW]